MPIARPFVLAAGLAVAAPAFAQSADAPQLERRALNDIRVERASITQTSPRGNNFGDEFVTMRDALENFPLDTSFGSTGVSAPPTSFTGPPGFQWPLNNLRGQSGGPVGEAPFVRLIDLALDPVGGPNGIINATRAIRLFSSVAQPPGGFYLGYNLRFGGDPAIESQLLPLYPTADNNARMSADYYISTIDQLFTFETTSVFIGFVTGRLLWGGVCTESFPGDCTDIGLPIGPVPHIYSLENCPDCEVTGIFAPARYCLDINDNPAPGCVPPAGAMIGDPVSPPIATWARFTAETSPDGVLRMYLDRLDGAGDVLIVHQRVVVTTFIDRVGANTSFESQDAFALIDNIHASGHVFGIATAPPLECPYLDSIGWLNTGPLLNQHPRWFAALSSAATVINDNAQGQVIRQTNNISPDNEYRREVSTQLPLSSATPANDLIATVDVRTTGGAVRGFALFDDTDLAARVYFGRDTIDAPYEPSAYVQTNPFHNPVDDPTGNDPFANNPVIGVDMADTGYDWIIGEYRTLEFRLSANGVLRVSIDGQRIYTGAGAFANTIDTFAFESENNSSGVDAQVRIDNVTVTCDAPSCAADFNLDDIVDFADLNTVLTNFGIVSIVPPQYFLGNTNGDDSIDFADLNAVLSAFGTSCD